MSETVDHTLVREDAVGSDNIAVKPWRRYDDHPGGQLRGPLALALAPNGNLVTCNGDAVNADPT
jgi:hypothetical protein